MTPPTMMLQDIMRITADYYGLDHHAVVGGSQSQACSWARHLAMHLASRHTMLSQSEIAAAAGVNASSVTYALRRVAERCRSTRLAADRDVLAGRVEQMFEDRRRTV